MARSIAVSTPTTNSLELDQLESFTHASMLLLLNMQAYLDTCSYATHMQTHTNPHHTTFSAKWQTLLYKRPHANRLMEKKIHKKSV